MGRTYSTDEITVYWDPKRCIHTAICLNALPEVFDTERRPWVTIEGASAAEVRDAIEKCPSGALTYELADGTREAPCRPTEISVRPNGPLSVRGDFEVTDKDGNVFGVGPRATLCRCGNTRNAPFCDLSHRRVGFLDNPHAVALERETAESPATITWTDE